MDRKDFILKSAGVILMSGLTVIGISQEPDKKPKIFTVVDKRCDGCGHCFKACRDKALLINNEGKAYIDAKLCKGCGDCVRFCRRMAIVEAIHTSTPLQD